MRVVSMHLDCVIQAEREGILLGRLVWCGVAEDDADTPCGLCGGDIFEGEEATTYLQRD